MKIGDNVFHKVFHLFGTVTSYRKTQVVNVTLDPGQRGYESILPYTWNKKNCEICNDEKEKLALRLRYE